jgi:hypothetical protein
MSNASQLPGSGPILAYFGGYAPADRCRYEIAVVITGATTGHLVSIHTGTIPGMRLEDAALHTAQGRPVRGDALRDQPIAAVDVRMSGAPQQLFDALLTHALVACHRGIALRQGGRVVGAVRLYGFTLPELRGGCIQASRLPDRLVVGTPPDHPQLWTPGVALTRLPRRHHRRAAQEDHPLWSA